MTASRIFFYFCLSFIGGIFLNSFFQISQISILILLILAIFLVAIFWKYKKLIVVGFSILFLVLGVWRHQSTELRIMNNELRKYNDSGQSITLIGIISDEPDIRGKSQRLTIKLENIEGKSFSNQPLIVIQHINMVMS